MTVQVCLSLKAAVFADCLALPSRCLNLRIVQKVVPLDSVCLLFSTVTFIAVQGSDTTESFDFSRVALYPRRRAEAFDLCGLGMFMTSISI